MSKRLNLEGKRFGRLTVGKLAYVRNGKPYWCCKCNCGNELIVEASHLRDGHSTSCGCSRAKHGQAKTRLYHIWIGMKSRCKDVSNPIYKYYGGRGIRICKEWEDNFDEFSKWAASNGYLDSLSIDRIDVNGNYEPSNCRWADSKTQSRNKTDNVYVRHNGIEMTLMDASIESGICYATLRARYHKGDRGERLFREVEEKFRNK